MHSCFHYFGVVAIAVIRDGNGNGNSSSASGKRGIIESDDGVHIAVVTAMENSNLLVTVAVAL